METYLTIEGLASHLKLAEQTIRRWVLNREVPYCKIKKVIRFRLSEIEKWIDNSGILAASKDGEDLEGDSLEENEIKESEAVDLSEETEAKHD